MIYFAALKYELIGGRNKNEGIVQITYNGQQGTICDYGWNSPDARTVCKQMGFNDGINVRYISND